MGRFNRIPSYASTPSFIESVLGRLPTRHELERREAYAMWWVLVLSFSLAIIVLLIVLYCCDWRTNKICSCSHQPRTPVAFTEVEGLRERWRMVSTLSDEEVEERTETVVSLRPSELPTDLNRVSFV